MADFTVDPSYVIPVLLEKRNTIMTDLTRAQENLKARSSLENATALARIAKELEKVSEQLKALGYSEDEERAIADGTLQLSKSSPPQGRSEMGPLASISDNATVAKKNQIDQQIPNTIQYMKPSKPAIAACAKCGKKTAKHPSGTKSYCSSCKAEAEILGMPPPPAASKNSLNPLQIAPRDLDDVVHQDVSSSPHGLPTPNSMSDPTGAALVRLNKRKYAAENATPRDQHERASKTKSKFSDTDKVSFHMCDMPCACPNTPYKHIIEIHGNTYALTCYVCGANAASDGKYFEGARGYHMYVLRHISETDNDLRSIFEKAMLSGCLEEVDDDDIQRIQKGAEPIKVKKACAKKTKNSDAKTTTMTKAKSEPKNGSYSTQTGGYSFQPPAQFEQLDSARYPTIMYFRGVWYDMWCHICGSNTITGFWSDKGRAENYGQFFKGMQGLHQHVVRWHKIDPQDYGYEKIRFEQVGRWCGKRELSSEDVDLIRAGKDPKMKIEKFVDFDTKFEHATGKGSLLLAKTIKRSTESNQESSSGSGPALAKTRDTISDQFHDPKPDLMQTPSPSTSRRLSTESHQAKPKRGATTFNRRAAIGDAATTRYVEMQKSTAQADVGTQYHSVHAIQRSGSLRKDDEEYEPDDDEGMDD